MRKGIFALLLAVGAAGFMFGNTEKDPGVAFEATTEDYTAIYTLMGANWSCIGTVPVGRYDAVGRGDGVSVAVRTVELACTNGMSGTVETTYRSSGMRMNSRLIRVSYVMSNGQQGEARF